MPRFIPGMKLNTMFYREIVRPLMNEHFPDLQYSAGLVGHGSDVLGFDTPKSTDHNWGPHLHMFFNEDDFIAYKPKVDEMLKTHLPHSYKGFPTAFKEGDKYLRDVPVKKEKGPVNHLFSFWTARSFYMHYLGFDIEHEPKYKDWLLFPQQSLVEVSSGKLFHDGIGLEKFRKKFAYYPDDIWKYMMRIQWGKILDELVMQARNGEVGDELGSTIVTARTINKIMNLCFFIERKYIPYTKWFGSAFIKLKNGKRMYTHLLQILHEKDWYKRQQLLAKAFQMLGRMHNKLGITKPLTTKMIDFFGRDYPIIDVWEYVEEIEKAIAHPKLKKMRYPLGAVDQFIDHARINHMDYFFLELDEVIK